MSLVGSFFQLCRDLGGRLAVTHVGLHANNIYDTLEALFFADRQLDFDNTFAMPAHELF